MDTYGKKQAQLSSQVFEQTDYSGYAPISKKKIDIDNVGHKSKGVAKGKKTDDVFKAGSKGYEPVKKDYSGYSASNAKQANLGSALDSQFRPASAAVPQDQNNPPVQSYTIPGRETKATKQAMLASNDPITGRSTLETYN